jgi:leader peptidase (prepilin peptidase)/N-methyltransferase
MEVVIVIKEIFYILSASSFALGACIASFLNVVIWRVPRGESIVFPPSHCPKCGKSIPWWMNVPILSWLLLGGKCRKCHKKIGVMELKIILIMFSN